MKSIVYFSDTETSHGKNLLNKLSTLVKKIQLDKVINKGDLVAIKLHWGELGNLAYLQPSYVRVIVEEVKKLGAKPFITDSNALYRGSRANAIDNIITAYLNGFSYDTIGAPIIVADGLIGLDYTKINFNGKHIKEVKIANSIYQSDYIIFLTHFKGHELYGFGGAIKNVGMGCTSRSGKQILHSDVKPKVNKNNCRGCGTCKKYCPAEAITIDKYARIDYIKCIGCAECVVVCNYNGIGISWQTDKVKVQEKTAEYVKGILDTKEKKCCFFNFLINITPNCDCNSYNEPAIISDIGILASFDIVAIDKASVDLVNHKVGCDKFYELWGTNWRIILEYANKIGLGNINYELIKI